MNINKENYEEYFLLYADNELSIADRQAVEAFVKENVHLQKELEDILATIQRPDQTGLRDKSFLFKPESEFIHESNYEEKFVEYTDGELNAKERELTENYIAGDEKLRHEFESIRRARMQPDLKITYPYKSALYKKPAKVKYLNFIKIAVAAALTGALIWAGIHQFTDHSAITEQQIASSTEIKERPLPELNQSSDRVPKPETQANHPADKLQEKSQLVKNKEEKTWQTVAQEDKQESKTPVQPEENSATQLALTTKPEITTNMPEIGAPLSVAAPVIDAPETPAQDMPLTASALQENSAQDAFTFLADEPQANDYVFYDIPADKLRNSKLGVFIKKVKRTIDRGNPINRFLNGDDSD